MQQAMRPGATEQELWAILSSTNLVYDGDWTEGRMLASGPRTNPWYQEATPRAMQAGELVAFDTDMVGPFGYCADVSRTWLCGGGQPSARQRELYRRAYDEIEHNVALVRPGMTFKQFSDQALRHPEEFVALRYACVAHGVGMCDEYPKIYYRQDWERTGYDGVIEPNMTLCIESYVGAAGGSQGVKLEECVLVTESGCERLSSYPFEDPLLA